MNKNKENEIPENVAPIAELDEAKINKMDATQIDNLKVAKEKQAIIADRLYNVIEVEMNTLDLDILKVRAKKKKLEIVFDKAGHNKSILRKQISILISKYWIARTSGA